jgi:hypothetical protein
MLLECVGRTAAQGALAARSGATDADEDSASATDSAPAAKRAHRLRQRAEPPAHLARPALEEGHAFVLNTMRCARTVINAYAANGTDAQFFQIETGRKYISLPNRQLMIRKPE